MNTKNQLLTSAILFIATSIFILGLLYGFLTLAQDSGKKTQAVKGAVLNMKELEKQEKQKPDTLKKNRMKEAPKENTKFRKTPIPKNAKIKKNDIKPGYLKKGNEKQNNNKKTNVSDSTSMPLIPVIPGLNGSGYGYLRPPDMGGAVNNNYLVEALNSQIGCYDKTGASLSKVDLFTFFYALLPAKINSNLTLCDPHVVYDSFAKRWIIVVLFNANSDTSSIAIAISNTDDPTANWTGYSFYADPTGDSWLDFPTIGLNKNWIAIGGNFFAISNNITAATNAANCQITTNSPHGFHTGDKINFYGAYGMTQLNGNTYTITVTGANTFLLNANSTAFGVYTTSPYEGVCQNVTNTHSVDLFVIDKTAMYAGGSPSVTLYNPEGFTLYPALVCDNTTNNLPVVFDAYGNSGGSGYLGFYSISGTPAAPVLSPGLTSYDYLSVPNPWSDYGPGAPQQGSSNLIDNNDSRMEQVVLRNGCLWCAHTVFLPATTPTHSAVQWWQIDTATLVVQQFGRIEDATGNIFYAFPSIDVNKFNDVVVGFSSFSSTQYGSADFAFHLHSDASGTMNPDVVFKNGLAKNDLGRWGDFSSTVTDTDSLSIWTLQEYAESQVNGIDQWGTAWNKITMPNLYSQDCPADLGHEPDNSGCADMWDSQDIYFGDASGNMLSDQNAYYPGPPNVCVVVRNIGAGPSLGTEQLNLYWAKGGTYLIWPDSWGGAGLHYFDPPSNTMLMGEPIATPFTIPVIQPGATYTVIIPWNNIPNPTTYASLSSNPNALFAQDGDPNHFCLLSRITTSTTAPYGMSFPETSDPNANAQNNAKIVWRNIQLYDQTVRCPPLCPDKPFHVVIGNLTAANIGVKIRFNMVDAEGVAGYLNKGKLNVVATGNLKSIIKRSRVSGDGFKETGEGTFEINKDGATIENINLNPLDIGTFDITFTPNDANDAAKAYALTVTQINNINGTDHIAGGLTYVFGKVKGFRTTAAGSGNPSKHWKWWIVVCIIIIIIIIVVGILWSKKAY